MVLVSMMKAQVFFGLAGISFLVRLLGFQDPTSFPQNTVNEFAKLFYFLFRLCSSSTIVQVDGVSDAVVGNEGVDRFEMLCYSVH